MENLDHFINKVKKDFHERGSVNSRFYGKPDVCIFKEPNELAKLNFSSCEFSTAQDFDNHLESLEKLRKLLNFLNLAQLKINQLKMLNKLKKLIANYKFNREQEKRFKLLINQIF